MNDQETIKQLEYELSTLKEKYETPKSPIFIAGKKVFMFALLATREPFSNIHTATDADRSSDGVNMRVSAMNKNEKRLRKWLQRNKWHTSNTPTGRGFYIESPIENSAGSVYRGYDPKTKQNREYAWERFLGIELDRFTCDYVSLSIHKRKHWWKRDNSVPEHDCFGYSWVPSDDFDEWVCDSYINIPADDILKIAELIKATRESFKPSSKRSWKTHLRFIDRNTGYADIKWSFSNDRLRQQRGFATRAEMEAMKEVMPNDNK